MSTSLADAALREGNQRVSGSWPTIPQLYYQGSLAVAATSSNSSTRVGNCSLRWHEGGRDQRTADQPLTAGAVTAIREASKEAERGQHLRMELKQGGRNIDMYFDKRSAQ